MGIGRLVDVVDGIFDQKHMDIINKLKPRPRDQLEYTLLLFKSKEYFLEGTHSIISIEIFKEELLEEQEVSRDLIEEYKKIMNLHVELLCEYKPNDILQHLKRKCYPKKLCLEVCKRYENNQALAYLYREAGLYEESLDTYIVLLLKVADKLLDPSIHRDHFEVNLTEYKKLFGSAVKVCLKHAILCENSELGYQLLNHVKTVNLKISQLKDLSTKTIEQIKNLLNDSMNKLILGIVGHANIENIIKRLAEKYSELRFENFRSVFNAAIMSYTSQKNLLDTAKNIFVYERLICFQALIKSNRIGISIKNIECVICGRLANLGLDKEFLAFTCGHVYHVSCTDTIDECDKCISMRKGKFG